MDADSFAGCNTSGDGPRTVEDLLEGAAASLSGEQGGSIDRALSGLHEARKILAHRDEAAKFAMDGGAVLACSRALRAACKQAGRGVACAHVLLEMIESVARSGHSVRRALQSNPFYATFHDALLRVACWEGTGCDELVDAATGVISTVSSALPVGASEPLAFPLGRPGASPTICVEEGDFVQASSVASETDGGTGYRVWESGGILVRWLGSHPEFVRGFTVLELGSGSGVGGIAALALGAAHCVLTDANAAARALSMTNLQRNSVTDRARVLHLDWLSEDFGGAEVSELESFRRVIGADIVYCQEHAHGIVRVLRRYLAPGGKALLVLPHHRDGVDLICDLVQQECGFRVSISGTKLLGDDCRDFEPMAASARSSEDPDAPFIVIAIERCP